jgi:hypothetical protein
MPGCPDPWREVVQILEARPKMVTLKVNGRKPVVVTDEEQIEILPAVKVQVGVKDGLNISGSRLAFDAPRYIQIQRVRERA